MLYDNQILTFNLPTWNTVITDISIPTFIAVYGNGKTIGLTDGTNYFSIRHGSTALASVKNSYGINVGTTTGDAVASKTNTSIGVTTETNGKSGIVAKSNSITKTSQSYNFCIKY